MDYKNELKTMLSMIELIARHVLEAQLLQSTYFRTRTGQDLSKSKQAERELYKLATQYAIYAVHIAAQLEVEEHNPPPATPELDPEIQNDEIIPEN